MALTDIPDLTIAIPTYNRAKFVERNLNFLLAQKQDFEQSVEILISDNCSTDTTYEIVKKFQRLGLEINYIKNQENMGPDLNILQCYKAAKGRYILTMGDDDVLLVGAIKNLLRIINENSLIGSIFLKPIDIDKIKSNYTNEDLVYEIFNGVSPYLERVSFNITFISSNIINKSVLDQFNFEKWVGTYLIQVPIILGSVKLEHAKNIIVKTSLLAAQDDNSGGYNFFKVFGGNLNDILKDILKENDYCRKLIINDLFIYLFPKYLIKLKRKTGTYANINKDEIINVLDYNFYFWILVYPILVLFSPADSCYYFISKVFASFRYKLLSKFYFVLRL